MDRALARAADALAAGTCARPFEVLGIHPLTVPDEPGRVVRCFIPWARSVGVRVGRRKPVAMERLTEAGLFERVFADETEFFTYRLEVEDPNGTTWTLHDPYRFLPSLDEGRARDFVNGREHRIHEVLGAHPVRHQGVKGTRFAVWAPHARAVSVSGTMNMWDGRCHPMRPRGALGVWELFIPGVEEGALYKYVVVQQDGSRVDKADPCGRASELRPRTASVVWKDGGFAWGDRKWMSARARADAAVEPMSVYEVHLGSWRRHDGRGGSATGNLRSSSSRT